MAVLAQMQQKPIIKLALRVKFMTLMSLIQALVRLVLTKRQANRILILEIPILSISIKLQCCC